MTKRHPAFDRPHDDWRHRVPENNGETPSGNQPIDPPPFSHAGWHRRTR